MQQMFGLVNILLMEHAETRKRRLRIRTYKVIPLSPCAGLLQWVENTMPIGEYLIGSPKNLLQCAHVRYRPKDKLSTDCRKELSEANGMCNSITSHHKQNRTNSESTKRYVKISVQFFITFSWKTFPIRLSGLRKD